MRISSLVSNSSIISATFLRPAPKVRTCLPKPVRGQYYYLYLIEDIYSRKGVGWEVYEQESGELAAGLMQRTVLAEFCAGQPLVQL